MNTTIATEMLHIPAHDGGAFDVYLAKPKDCENAPVVICIQEIFGINQEMKDKCAMLAQQGYIAVAPDLFWRIEPGISLVDSVPEQLERAFELFGLFDVHMGVEDLKSVLGYMRLYEGASGRVGCVGYCLGGKLAYMMSTHSDIDASVSYYGVAIETMLEDAVKIKKPLMLHMAGADEFVPPEAQEQIKVALIDHPQVTIHSYAGQNHAFARGQGMHYNAEAAALAQERALTFLAEKLGL